MALSVLVIIAMAAVESRNRTTVSARETEMSESGDSSYSKVLPDSIPAVAEEHVSPQEM